MMTQIPPDQQGLLGGLAYRLGYAAISLDLDARRRWDSAEPGEPEDEIFGPEERGSAFPRELGRYAGVIDDASRGLVGALPELTRDQLHEALRRAWLALRGAWLGPSHRRMIVEREEGGAGGGDTTAASPMGWREWCDFHLAVHQFCESLPEGARDCAALGAHVAAVRGLQPPGHRQEPLPDTVSPSPFAVLEGLLPRVIECYPSLQGLELDLGEERFDATNDKPPHCYWSWRQKQAERLNDQIVARLPEIERAAGDTSEEWISAKEAGLLARKYGVELPLHRIRNLIAQDSAPFRSRKPSPQRLDVRLTDLLLYIHTERERNQIETPGRSVSKELSELQQHDNILTTTRQRAKNQPKTEVHPESCPQVVFERCSP